MFVWDLKELKPWPKSEIIVFEWLLYTQSMQLSGSVLEKPEHSVDQSHLHPAQFAGGVPWALLVLPGTHVTHLDTRQDQREYIIILYRWACWRLWQSWPNRFLLSSLLDFTRHDWQFGNPQRKHIAFWDVIHFKYENMMPRTDDDSF